MREWTGNVSALRSHVTRPKEDRQSTDSSASSSSSSRSLGKPPHAPCWTPEVQASVDASSPPTVEKKPPRSPKAVASSFSRQSIPGTKSMTVTMERQSPPNSGGRPPRPSLQEVECAVATLDQRATQVVQAEDTRVRMLTYQAQRLPEELQRLRVTKEVQLEKRFKEINKFEATFWHKLHKLREERAILRNRLEVTGEKLLEESREEISKTCSRDAEEHENSVTGLTARMEQIQNAVEEISASEDKRGVTFELGERISGTIRTGLQKAHDALEAEQKMRADTEQSLMKAMEDVYNRINAEIKEEREKREIVQSRLLGLLEQTCGRIEVSLTDLRQTEERPKQPQVS